MPLCSHLDLSDVLPVQPSISYRSGSQKHSRGPCVVDLLARGMRGMSRYPSTPPSLLSREQSQPLQPKPF